MIPQGLSFSTTRLPEIGSTGGLGRFRETRLSVDHPLRGENVAGAPRTRRRTVRIVESRSTTRTAVVSFLITAAAAMFALVIWLSLRPAVVEGPIHRVLQEVDLDWRCDAGHAWRAKGQIEPRVCMTQDCGRDMIRTRMEFRLMHV